MGGDFIRDRLDRACAIHFQDPDVEAAGLHHRVRQGCRQHGAAKAAIASWNVDLARELGPRGVTANVVAPGFTQDTEYFRGRLTERRGQLIEETATGRAGTPDDVAGAIHFLGSGAARQITAQVLAVNGGAFPTR